MSIYLAIISGLVLIFSLF